MRSVVGVLRPRGSYQAVRLLAAAAAALWVGFGQPVLVPFAVGTVVIVIVTTAAVLWLEHGRERSLELYEVPWWLIVADLAAISSWTLGTAANPESTAFVLFGAVAAETTFRFGRRGALVAFSVFVLVRMAQEVLRIPVVGSLSSPTRFSSEIIVVAVLIGLLTGIADSYREAQLRATALERAAVSFGTSKDLPELAARLAAGALTIIQADYAFLVQRGAPLFRIVAVAGAQPPALPRDIRGGIVAQVLRERRTVQVNDDASADGDQPPPHAAGVRVVMATPIFVEDQVAAGFVVGRYAARRFDARDRQMLEAFAGHAAIAFRDAQFLSKTRQLESLTRDIAVEGDEHALLQRVSDAAAELLEVESAVVSWIEPGREEGPRASSGLARQLPFGRGALSGARAWVQREGRRLLIEDYQTWAEATPQAKALGVRATMAEPISVDGKIVAALIVSTTQEVRRFTESECGLVTALAAHASVAIRNARLRHEREQRAEHLARLNVVARELSAARDLPTLYDRVYRATCDLVPTDSFYLSLYDHERRQHTFVLQVDEGREWDRDAMFPLGEGPTSGVVKTGFPYVTLKAEPNAVRFGNQKRPSHSAIHVPMRVGEKIVGVLSAQRYVENGFTGGDVALLEALASHAAAAIENAQLLSRTHELYMASVRALAAAVDARDPYTRSHSARTSALARAIADEMGLPHEEIRRVQLGALLHDIGKIGIPDAVLNKPGTFTHEERLVMMTHAALGGAILQAVEPLRELAPIVRHHHERFDGAGYPDGLSGDEVPLASYVVAAADAFEVIVSKRAYKEAQSIEFAVEELHRHSGRQFHPTVVEAFIRVIERDQLQGAGYFQRLGQAGHEELESQIAGPATLVEEFAATSRAHTRQLAILQRLASEITAVLDIETLADRLLRIVCEAMAYENGFLLTLSEAGDHLEVRAAVGPSTEYRGHRLPSGRGISWEVLESGRPVNTPDVRQHSGFFGPPEVRSSLIVPLVLGSERVGVLGVESPRPDAFGNDDEQLLMTVSHQLAAAIRVARLHQEAKTAAATDPLTGLANRRVFFERLEAEILRARQMSSTLAVAMVDVNRLKTTNDTLGHRAGDAALQRIAAILTAGVRSHDLVARLGGDEFAVLFPGLTQLGAERVMRRLALRIESDSDAPVDGGLPSIAWGIAPLAEGPVSADLIVDAADRAMYRHKTMARQRASKRA